jgi:hypothetical protein
VFTPCTECGAPLDRNQRYCVNCAARRTDVANPSATYFASASASTRRGQRPVAPAKGAGTGARVASIAFLALLPIAVAVGVLVGRDGNETNDDALLKALRSQNTLAAAGPAVAAGAAGDQTAGSTATGDSGSAETVANQVISTDFGLKRGYTVLLAQVPISASAQEVADASADLQKKGAKDVGVIDPAKFKISPDQGKKNYLLYSGEFEGQADANAALSKLKGKFPEALVIKVTDLTDETGAVVVAHTEHGDLHQVTNFDPPADVVAEDTALVRDLATETGADYTDQQQSLPDIIVVGGDPEDAPPLPTGGGD